MNPVIFGQSSSPWLMTISLCSLSGLFGLLSLGEASSGATYIPSAASVGAKSGRLARIELANHSLAYVIHRGESRRRGYNDYNRGSLRCRGSNRKNLRLTRWTVRKVQRAQSRGSCTSRKLFAVGIWQIIPSTMNKAVSSLGINKGVRLSPALQNRIFVDYITKRKRPAIHGYVTTGSGLNKAGLEIALEWASMQSPVNRTFYGKQCRKGVCKKIVTARCRTGQGCYDGNGTNHAHTSYKRVRSALVGARNKYLTLTRQGYSASSAYALSLGVNNL